MHEQRRFAIALAGLVGCLAIAGGILLTAPSVQVVNAPPHPAGSWAMAPLPKLPVPHGLDAGNAPASAAARKQPVGRAQVRRSAVPRPDVPELVTRNLKAQRLQTAGLAPVVSSLVLSDRGTPVVNTPTAHRETAAGVAVPPERGAITGAFVTAGTHVSEGFKTVGRTLRRVF